MINREVEILNEMHRIISSVDKFEFDSFEYEYKLNKSEGWVSLKLVYKLGELIVSQNDFELINENLLEELSENLHLIMSSKTGGEWTRLILSSKDGKLKTKFSYQEQLLTGSMFE